MQDDTLFGQQAVASDPLTMPPGYDLTISDLHDFSSLAASNLANAPPWEFYPNMPQASIDVQRPRTAPSFAARPSMSALSGAHGSSSAGATRRNSTITVKVEASDQPTLQPSPTTLPTGAGPSLGPADPTAKPRQKRKAEPRRSAVVKLEESPVAPARRNRFLERNRLAASKCREKKKVRVHELEETKVELEMRYRGLRMEYESLMEEVTRIKNSLVNHARCSDPRIDSWIHSEARRFVKRAAERPPSPCYSISSRSQPDCSFQYLDSPMSEAGTTTKRSLNYDHMTDDMSNS